LDIEEIMNHSPSNSRGQIIEIDAETRNISTRDMHERVAVERFPIPELAWSSDNDATSLSAVIEKARSLYIESLDGC
jgi:hypothetical protein